MIRTLSADSKNTYRELSFSLDILSWNICDAKDKILGAKTSLQEFQTQLKDRPIFCLQETKNEIKIADYECWNKLRSDSHSGGLCIGVRKEMLDFVKIINTDEYDDIMAVTISGDLFNLQDEVVLVNIYDSPENSSYKTSKKKLGNDKRTLDDLSSFLSSPKCGKQYVVVGDLNARTANLSEPARSDETLESLMDGSFMRSSYPMTTTRNSEDDILNERGRRLLDLIAEADMKLLNGSTLGDVFGRYTCLHYNGSSVVDYMMVSNCLASYVSHFRVLDFTNISDHRPITCRFMLTALPIIRRVNVNFTDQPKGYLWNKASSPPAFKSAQGEPDYMAALQSAMSYDCQCKDDVKKINEDLTNLLTNAANLSLETKGGIDRKRGRRKSRKHPWFDLECIKARIELRKNCKKYCKTPLNTEIRSTYYAMRKEYRKLITQKKNMFQANLNKEIEDGKEIKWESFKKLKSQKNTKEDDMDLYDI